MLVYRVFRKAQNSFRITLLIENKYSVRARVDLLQSESTAFVHFDSVSSALTISWTLRLFANSSIAIIWIAINDADEEAVSFDSYWARALQFGSYTLPTNDQSETSREWTKLVVTISVAHFIFYWETPHDNRPFRPKKYSHDIEMKHAIPNEMISRSIPNWSINEYSIQSAQTRQNRLVAWLWSHQLKVNRLSLGGVCLYAFKVVDFYFWYRPLSTPINDLDTHIRRYREFGNSVYIFYVTSHLHMSREISSWYEIAYLINIAFEFISFKFTGTTLNSD